MKAEGDDGTVVGNIANLVQAEDDVGAEGHLVDTDNVVFVCLFVG